MKYTILGFLLLSLSIGLSAQKHDYQWIMGYRSNLSNPYYGKFKLDFNTRPLHIDTVRTNMNFDGFSVTCSDSSGNLLFYSNGIRIYNKENQLMENGDKINPGSVWDSNQNDGYPELYGGIALPAPGTPNCYYLIHLAFSNYTAAYGGKKRLDISPKVRIFWT